MAAAGAEVAAVVDPAPAARAFAETLGAPWFASIHEAIDAGASDGAIIATPNQLHVEHGLACIAAGLPALIEKPIASTVAEAEALVAGAEAARVPLLVGHHRRHNPIIQRAKAEIEAGALGQITIVNGMCWLRKPDDYFAADWRRRQGAGPVFINLIHDVDLLRHLCGDVRSVQALDAREARGFEVEDTAAALLSFASGAMGALSVSDCTVAPWSWELTARENPAYPPTGQSCYMIGGTHAALELPNLRLWRHPGERSWWAPIDARSMPVAAEDPLIAQIRHFVDVINGAAKPLVSAHDGLEALRIVEAVTASAKTGEKVAIAPSQGASREKDPGS